MMKLFFTRHGAIISVLQIGTPGQVANAMLSRFAEITHGTEVEYGGRVGAILQLFTTEIILNSFAEFDTDACEFADADAANHFLTHLGLAARMTANVHVSHEPATTECFTLTIVTDM